MDQYRRSSGGAHGRRRSKSPGIVQRVARGLLQHSSAHRVQSPSASVSASASASASSSRPTSVEPTADPSAVPPPQLPATTTSTANTTPTPSLHSTSERRPSDIGGATDGTLDRPASSLYANTAALIDSFKDPATSTARHLPDRKPRILHLLTGCLTILFSFEAFYICGVCFNVIYHLLYLSVS